MSRVDHCTFQNNTLFVDSPRSTTSAAAAFFLSVSSSSPKQGGSSTVVNGCTFMKNALICRYTTHFKHNGALLHSGALLVQLAGYSVHSSVIIQNSHFSNNMAVIGGALAIYVYENAADNLVSITNSNFQSNIATGRPECPLKKDDSFGYGGAVAISFLSGAYCNRVNFYQDVFRENGATEGGAVFADFVGFRYTSSNFSSCTELTVGSCTFVGNVAQVGAAMSWRSDEDEFLLSSSGLQTTLTVDDLLVSDSTFVNNRAYFRGAFAITLLPVSFSGNVTFFNNLNSALSLQLSIGLLHDNCTLNFTGNTAEIGAGLLLQQSRIVVRDSSAVYFVNNTAMEKGGGVFASLNINSVRAAFRKTTTNCFIVSQNSSLPPPDWRFSAYFEGNMAYRGAGIYCPDISPCSWNEDADIPDPKTSFPWTTFVNNYEEPALQDRALFDTVPGSSLAETIFPRFVSWNPQWLPSRTEGFLNHTTLLLNAIATDVYKFSIGYKNIVKCKDISGHDFPYDTHPAKVTVHPGLPVYLPAIGCDQFNNTVSTLLSFTHQSSGTENSGPELHCFQGSKSEASTFKQAGATNLQDNGKGQQIRILQGERVLLNSKQQQLGPLKIIGINGSRGGFLRATAIGATKRTSIDIEVEFGQCPPGYYLKTTTEEKDDQETTTSRCECLDQINANIFSCTEDGTTVFVRANTYAILSNKNKLLLIACPPGYCNCNKQDTGYGCAFNTTQGAFQAGQCSSHRSGLMCGKCDAGYYPGAGLDGTCILPDRACSERGWPGPIIGAFCMALIVVYMLIRMQVYIPNHFRGCLFFGTMLPFILNPTDRYVINLTKDSNWLFTLTSKFLDVLSLKWDVNTCFYPLPKTAEDVVLYRFFNSGMLLIALLVILSTCKILEKCSHRLPSCSCWLGRENDGPEQRWYHRLATKLITFLKWLLVWPREGNEGYSSKVQKPALALLFFCLQSMMVASATLFQCVSVAGEDRFFWDATVRCGGKHGWPIVVLLFVIFCLFSFCYVIIFFWYKMHKADTIYIGNENARSADRFVNAISYDLRDDYHKLIQLWWVYDLLRRVPLLLIYLPMTNEDQYKWWLKRMLGMSLLILFLIVHLFIQPYMYTDVNEIKWYVLFKISKKFRDISNRWDLKRHPANIIEAVVLSFMVIIAQLSASSALGGIPDEDNGRIMTIHVLVLLVIIPGYVGLAVTVFKHAWEASKELRGKYCCKMDNQGYKLQQNEDEEENDEEENNEEEQSLLGDIQ